MLLRNMMMLPMILLILFQLFYYQKFLMSRKSMRIKLRMSMLVLLKKNLRSTKPLARSSFNFLNTTTLELILKGLLEMFLFSNMNLNTVTL